MADLVNELTWSFSRLACFKECRRKYYWNYYYKWNGWNANAPERVKLAYLLSKMTTTDLYAGQIAHQIIAWSVQRLRHGVKVHFENLEQQIDGMLHTGFQASIDKAWKINPKAVNFFEDYYGDGISDQKRADVTKKVNDAVSNFLGSGSYDKLSDPRVKMKWLAVDNDQSFSSFFLDGIKIYAEPDLAVQIADKCYLFDWKTGKESSDHDQQLICYSLYACSEWHFDPVNIVARAVYLNIIDRETSKPVERPVPYDEGLAGKVRETITNTFNDMAKLVTVDNFADIKDFPKCTREGTCRRCQFKQLCESDS